MRLVRSFLAILLVFLFAVPVSNAGILGSEVKGDIKVGNVVTFGRYYNHNDRDL